MSSTPKPTRGSTPVMQTKGYSPKAGLKRGSSFGDFNEPLGPPAMPALPAESLKRQKPHDKQMSGFIWSAKRQASIGGDSAEDMSDDSTAAAAVTQPQRAPRSASTASLQSLAAVDVSAATGQANDLKKEQRLARNREAARLRRLRSRARLEMLTAKVRDLESAVAAAERFTWGDGQPAELAQICAYDINSTAHCSWPGSPVDSRYFSSLQAAAASAFHSLRSSHEAVGKAHAENEALIAIANATLDPVSSMHSPQAIAGARALGLTPGQAAAIVSSSSDVESLRQSINDVSATVTTFIRPADAAAAAVHTPDSRLGLGSRRSSRSSSFSSLDSAASDRPTLQALQFPVVDFLCRKVCDSGLSSDQITTLYTFCARNDAVIAGLEFAVEPPLLAPAPIVRATPRVMLPVAPPSPFFVHTPHPSTVPPTAALAPSPKLAAAPSANAPAPSVVLGPPAALSLLHTSVSGVFSELAVGLDTPPPTAELPEP